MTDTEAEQLEREAAELEKERLSIKRLREAKANLKTQKKLLKEEKRKNGFFGRLSAGAGRAMKKAKERREQRLRERGLS
jgi:hypothetical protein